MFITENTVEKRVFLAAGQKMSILISHSIARAVYPCITDFRLLKTTENLSREKRLPNYSSVAHTKFCGCKKGRTQEPVENVQKNGIRQWVILRKKVSVNLSHDIGKNPPWREQGRRFILCGDVLIFKSHNAMLWCARIRIVPRCLCFATLFAADSHLVSVSCIHLSFIAFLNYLRVLKSLESTWEEFHRLCGKFSLHFDTFKQDFKSQDRREEFSWRNFAVLFSHVQCRVVDENSRKV